MSRMTAKSGRGGGGLACAAHPDHWAVGRCVDCGRGLCPECVRKFDPPFCDACLVRTNKRAERAIWLNLLATLAFTVLGGLYFRSRGVPLGTAAIDGVIVGFAWWGWMYLSRRAPRLYRASLKLRLAYLFAKVTAALLLGLVLGPVQLYRSLRRLRVLSSARALASQSRAGVA